ncbi:MAG: CBS domain-containing protein, partial [Oscillospiraceae bacterium]|nr:CBS domain-containing protein [Oscillospiraceae bacterium]
AAGKGSLSAVIKKIIVCDGDRTQLEERLGHCTPGNTLCVVGNRPELQTLIIQEGAHMLLTGNARPGDYQIMKADKNDTCILCAAQDTYVVMRLMENLSPSRTVGVDKGHISDWIQTPAYLYKNDIVADWQRFYRDNMTFLHAYPVVDDELNLCGSIDIAKAFASTHSQKLSGIVSPDARILTVSPSSTVNEVAGKLLLSGGQLAVVAEEGKMHGIVQMRDLLRCYMLTGGDKRTDISSCLTLMPDYSGEDRRVYELRVPEGESGEAYGRANEIILSAAAEHLRYKGIMSFTLSSASFFYPKESEGFGGLMVSTSFIGGNGGSFSLEAEINSEYETYAKAMLIFSNKDSN